MRDIRALTVRRPWSTLIASGHKPVENRVWDWEWRGTLLIHAGTMWARDAKDFAGPLVDLGDDYWQAARHPTGIVAVAELAGVCKDQPCGCGPWAMPDHYHWQLDQVRALDVPVPARGRLGLWHPSTELIAAVEAQIGVLA